MVDLQTIIKSVLLKGYMVFENDSKPFNLNIVGVRSSNIEVNKFNDSIFLFWKYEGFWNFFRFQATTLAGLTYLEKPMNPKGCAILKPNQYRGVWELGGHGKSKYTALVQRLGEVEVYRDNDQDKEYDLIEGKTEKGYFGINIHRASLNGERDNVDFWSAGCQVIQNPDEYDLFIKICEASSKHWENSFSYTLLNESDLRWT